MADIPDFFNIIIICYMIYKKIDIISNSNILQYTITKLKKLLLSTINNIRLSIYIIYDFLDFYN